MSPNNGIGDKQTHGNIGRNMQGVALEELVKGSSEAKHVEHIDSSVDNMTYDDADKEPELQARTYLALSSMFIMMVAQVMSLQSPPAVVSGLIPV
jgi:hypothetical protein